MQLALQPIPETSDNNPTNRLFLQAIFLNAEFISAYMLNKIECFYCYIAFMIDVFFMDNKETNLKHNVKYTFTEKEDISE